MMVPPPAAMIPPRAIASSASRQILWALAGGGGAIMFARQAREWTEPAPADGRASKNRIDRSEIRSIVSGPTGITTLVPLMSALVVIGTLYTKARILTPQANPMNPELVNAAKNLGVQVVAGEGAKNKSLYTFLGGTVLGGMAAEQIVFGGDPPRGAGVTPQLPTAPPARVDQPLAAPDARTLMLSALAMRVAAEATLQGSRPAPRPEA